MSKKDTNPFIQLGLRPWLAKQLTKLGKYKSKPETMYSHTRKLYTSYFRRYDCIGAAKTGSGKTFAFALPILEKLSEEPTSHFALVLTPTHELAYQQDNQLGVKSMFRWFQAARSGYRSTKGLNAKAHIIVAMPGRLADHLTGCDTFCFDNLKFLVVDEADRMLNGDFDESLRIIESCIPKQRQNLFFSATMKDFIKESSIFPIAKDCLEWSEEFETATVETLDQRYLLCADYDRDMVLIEALRKYREDNEDSKKNTVNFCHDLE
ncbi:hypothetical protein DOY81_014316 [Sarcophaga bullata]|nr:hypothetical protein DOY81_014316 [Sarcophaga bullata]